MNIISITGKTNCIALVAHDNKKRDLIKWAAHNSVDFAKYELTATGTTGKLLEDQLDRPVKKMLSGPLGGDQQIGAMIAEGKIDVLIFFWESMRPQPHDRNVMALLRLGVAWNILMASDRATAYFMFSSIGYCCRQGIHCCVRPQPLMNKDIKLKDNKQKLTRVCTARTAADRELQPIVSTSRPACSNTFVEPTPAVRDRNFY